MDILERVRAQVRASDYSFSFHAEREREDGMSSFRSLSRVLYLANCWRIIQMILGGIVVSSWALPGLAKQYTAFGAFCRMVGSV